MTTLAERAGWLASNTGVSLSETDALAGKTRGHWQAIVSGNVANPTLATLTAYAEICGASVGWLASGEGSAPPVDVIRGAVEAARARFAAPSSLEPEARDSHPAAG